MSKNKSTVILLTGRTGVGKSTLLDRFVKKHKGSVHLLNLEASGVLKMVLQG